ncbi:hypothetical protein [Colwellia sp. RSH04]|uniref:hypothetical protein n=1 Tax=Colwellia sp. RSH04 TaxID=2305464 RepID=UPI000E596A93|nr:hypothetical protein [Colwellia sp. RSH04]RHW77240.1 hypothetical protein D1094_04960 [Colwellia sp. RSH04]
MPNSLLFNTQANEQLFSPEQKTTQVDKKASQNNKPLKCMDLYKNNKKIDFTTALIEHIGSLLLQFNPQSYPQL